MMSGKMSAKVSDVAACLLSERRGQQVRKPRASA